ncbi:MAG: hypothetical protein COB02_14835 [Candidatus Cloacimonadota bacterium]|nr:MAG: hypothetical protein COB02_14835 [Candidatus Cloacimonadota bacterium]
MKQIISFTIIATFLFLLLSGCGGGGTTGQDGSSGLGSSFSGNKTTLSINFANILNLSKSRIANDWQLIQRELSKTIPKLSISNLSEDVTIGSEIQLSEFTTNKVSQKLASYLSIQKATSTIRNKISEYRVLIQDPFNKVLWDKRYPSTQQRADDIQVESGPDRKITVEGIGIDFDGVSKVLVTAEAKVNLEPAEVEVLGGNDATIPIEFVVKDSLAPVTAIFHAGTGVVEGPHRSVVEITISNFENATVFYEITEQNNPASTLNILTSGFQSAFSTAIINLTQEARYIFKYYSIDQAQNQENLHEKLVIVNFNQGAPVSSINYKGKKFFAGAEIGLSVLMQNSQTATIKYTIDGGTQVVSPELKNKELYLVQLGTQGFIPQSPITVVNFSSEIKDGSLELSTHSTSVELTDISINGTIKTTFEGASTSFYGSEEIFCDTDSTSIYLDQTTCLNQGKLRKLEMGAFVTSQGTEFSQIEIVGGEIRVVKTNACDTECVDQTSQACKSCVISTPGIDCSLYKKATGINCPN